MTTESTNTPASSGKAALALKIGFAVLFVVALIAVIVAAVKVSRNSRIHRENEAIINEQLKKGSFTINPPA